jgi:hypothetical protein
MYEGRKDFSASTSLSPVSSYSVMVLHSLIIVLSTPYGCVTESVVAEPTEIERRIICSSMDLKELGFAEITQEICYKLLAGSMEIMATPGPVET